MTTAASDSDVQAAADALRAGTLVAFPTETVYGLGALITDEAAIRRIYDVKSRPRSQALLAHVSGVPMARTLVEDWPERADALARQFWPGPLTMVLRKSPHAPDIATGGGTTIGLRCPDHDVALRLIDAVGDAIAGTSANRSGEPSPVTPEQVRRAFEPDVVHVLDAGRAPGGLESTVLLLGDSERDDRILRPGPIGAAALGLDSSQTLTGSQEQRDQAIVRLVSDEDLNQINVPNGSVLITHHTPAPRFDGACVQLPPEAEAYSREMYDAIHRATASRSDRGWILVVEPQEAGEVWDAIRQRLNRLSGKN